MSERVLVTGAQGFLGRYLCALLLSDGPAEVLGLGRSARLDEGFTHKVTWGTARVRAPLPDPVREALASPHYHYASLDVGRQSELTGLLGDFRPDVVFHLASGLRDAPADHLFRTNVEGTVSMIEAIQESGIAAPRIVFGSTGFLYGRIASEALPVGEDTPPAPIDLYGVSKLAGEQVSRILTARYGVPAIWSRIFNLVGPGQEERHFCGRVAALAAAIAAGVLPPLVEVEPLTATRDFLDVRDAARALVALARRGEPGGSYNVGSGIESPVAEVFREILRQAGLDGRTTVEEKAPRPADIPRYVADVRRLRALGHADQYPLNRSLGDLLAWYAGPVSRAAHRARRVHRPLVLASVEADRSHRYPVEIAAGLLERLPERLAGMFPAARMVVLTDDTVLQHYGACLLEGLRARGVEAAPLLLPPGERSKSAADYLRLIQQLHDLGFDRRALLVNLGGGIVTDTGGFVAASYLRGVAYVNVPTTLLAQLDAAIGGKVAVNMPWAKNFVGAFAHPRAVFTDPAVLRTLSPRELCAGVAEALKVAIIGDPDLFELLEAESEAVRLGQDAAVLGEVVARASQGKIALLAPDPYEHNLRRALNFGHTFGHALEVQTGYDRLLHGEAVGFGIAVATAVARRRGMCTRASVDRIFQALYAYGLPPPVPRSDLVAACGRLDAIRLVRGRRLNYVLPAEIGRVEIVAELEDHEIPQAIDDIAAHPVIGGSVGPG